MDRSIFISYAHIDDQPLTVGQEGWISRFKTALESLLSMRLGRTASVWRDEKLQGNDFFGEEIIERLAESDVLVPVLSSRYLNSAWCTKEISQFCQLAETRGGLSVGNKARVFKIIKTPVESQAPLPESMRDLLGYEFFTVKEGAPLELDPAYGHEFAQLFNQKVAVLAWHIAELLKTLETQPHAAASVASAADMAGPASAAPAKPVIYLAECSYDGKPARERLEAELVRLGYSVLPDQRLPMDEAEYIAAVTAQLERADLSVHVIGEHFGAVPDGPTTKSVPVHQNELAALRSAATGMPRLIWMPEALAPKQPLQVAFVEALRSDRETRRGADLITGDFEVLRTTLQQQLKKIEDARKAPAAVPEPGEVASGEATQLVYMVFDERDRKASVPLRKWLKAQGFEVATPLSEGDAAQVRLANQEQLARCDAVMIFYGCGDEAWKRAVQMELRKMAGYRLDKPPPLVRTYLALPDTADKGDMVDMDEAGLIDGRSALNEVALSAFSEALRAAERVSA